MTVHTKLKYLPIAALAVAVSLTGCGGGGDDPVVTSSTPTTPTTPATPDGPGPMGMTQEALTAAMTALEMAEAALAALMLDGSATQDELKAAQDAVDAAMMALDEAQTAHDTYVAMQPPMYDMAALDTAIGTPGTQPTVLLVRQTNTADDTIRGGKVTAADYEAATWPVPAITDWAGSVYEHEDGTSVVVYTDIDDPGNLAFSEYYASETVDDRAEISAVVDGVLTLENAEALELISGVGLFPTGDRQTFTFMDDERMVDGMFNGIPGTFECTDTTCTVTTDEEGELLSATGTWTFTPDDATDEVMGVVPDDDYLDFGYWVMTEEDEDGETTYMVNTFHRGEDLYGDVSRVEGSATYAGGAAGLFTKREFSSGGMGELVGAGRFTAKANLTAYFGGGDIGTNKQFTIDGDITDFMHNGEPIDNSWMVSLARIIHGAA